MGLPEVNAIAIQQRNAHGYRSDSAAPDSPSDRAKIALKISAVMAAVGRIEKRGTNEHFKYKFAMESDVLDAVRAALVENKLALSVDMLDVIQEPSGNTNRAGAPIFRTRVTLQFDLIDCETGYMLSRNWCGESLEGEDKGLQKAATSGTKYFLLKTFLIPTGDDPDAAGPATTATKTKAAPTEKPASPKTDPRQAIANQIIHECTLHVEQVEELKGICKAKGAKLSDMLIEAKDAGCKDFFEIRAYIEDGEAPA